MNESSDFSITGDLIKGNEDIFRNEIEKNDEYYSLFFDGSSKGNPGIAGAGFVIYDKHTNELFHDSFFVGEKKTNNFAEYTGLIRGLEEASRQNIRKINVCGDSLLVINQMNGVYKVNSLNLLPLYEIAKNLEKKFDSISYKHIYRKYNKRADELANIGGSSFLVDF